MSIIDQEQKKHYKFTTYKFEHIGYIDPYWKGIHDVVEILLLDKDQTGLDIMVANIVYGEYSTSEKNFTYTFA